MKNFAVADYITGDEIKRIRRKLKLTQAQFAELANISRKTVERWETGEKEITGPVVTLIKILEEYPQIEENLVIPEKKYPMRLWYMFHQEICTVIDVDEQARKLVVYNFTNKCIKRAFGREDKPTFEQYEEFLESRCFPRTRDKMKIMLKELGLPFYDPLMIIEKTQGRMAEDDFWLKVER